MIAFFLGVILGIVLGLAAALLLVMHELGEWP